MIILLAVTIEVMSIFRENWYIYQISVGVGILGGAIFVIGAIMFGYYGHLKEKLMKEKGLK